MGALRDRGAGERRRQHQLHDKGGQAFCAPEPFEPREVGLESASPGEAQRGPAAGLETHSTAFLAVPDRCLSAFRKQVFLGPGDAQHMQGSPFHPQKALSSSLSQRTVAGAVEEEARFEPRL